VSTAVYRRACAVVERVNTLAVKEALDTVAQQCLARILFPPRVACQPVAHAEQGVVAKGRQFGAGKVLRLGQAIEVSGPYCEIQCLDAIRFIREIITEEAELAASISRERCTAELRFPPPKHRNCLLARQHGIGTEKGNGGEGGIRTPDTLTGMSDFESGAFNRALPPLRFL
jgi:hypothetical protein